MALEQYLFFAIGIFLLIRGSNYLVDGSSSLAKRFGVSTLLIGLTVVSIGTTTPELIVNIMASLKGAPEIAFGNIIGSNITNILLVLGVAAIISPIVVKSSSIRKEIPFAIIAACILLVFSNQILIDQTHTNTLTRVSGIMLLTFFALFIYYAIDIAAKSRKQIEPQKLEIERRHPIMIAVMIIGGIVALFIGGRLTVEGAILISSQLHLSEFLISATVIAIGTSLPELFVAIQAARKNETGIIVGNIIGANIFNILWILGITALISPITIPEHINTDIFIMGGVSILLFIMIFIGKKHEIERWQGWVFLALYVIYLLFLGIRG